MWLVGASGAFEPDGTNTRRVRIRRGGTADITHSELTLDAPSGRRTAFHVAAQVDLNSTEDHFKCEIYQDSGGTLDIPVRFQPPRFWALWLAENTAQTNDYADTGITSGIEVHDIWQNIRANQYRVQRRPSASMYRSGTQSISASSQTKIVFNAEEHDTDSNQNDTSLGHITVAEDGWYLVTWGVATSSLSGSTASLNAYLYRDSSNVGTATQSISDTDTSSLHGVTMTFCTAGQELSVEVQSTTGFTVAGNRGTFIRSHLLSSDSGVSANRQLFGPIPPAAEIPTIADMSSDRIPLATLRLASDLTDRMWHRPVIRLRTPEPGNAGNLSNDDGWTGIACNEVLTDYTDLEGMGYNLTGDGGFRAPFAGTWLVVGYIVYGGTDEDGNNVGSTGYRGCRLVRNGGAGIGSIIRKSAKSASAGWVQWWVEPFVLNEGDTVSIQGLTGNMSGDPGVLVTDVQMFIAEIGDGITRDAA